MKVLFIYLWLRWLFIAVRGFSLVAGSGGYALVSVRRLLTVLLLWLRGTGSRVSGLQELQRMLSSCGSRA